MGVRQLRLVVTAEDFDAMARLYRDVLGMPVAAEFPGEDGGRVLLLDAGRATLELADPRHAAGVDRLEVGRPVASTLRVALEVDDAAVVTDAAVGAGAVLIASPVETPWRSLNARLEDPAGVQLTLFQELAGGDLA